VALTLPIVNNSTGTWGGILNTALTDLDNRLETVTTTTETTNTDLANLDERVTTLENAGGGGGGGTAGLTVVYGTLPTPTIGAAVLDGATGYLHYGADINGTATFVPFPGSFLAKLKRIQVQAYGNNTFGALAFDAADTDRLGGWSAANPTRYTAMVPGSYEFTGAIGWATNATGIRQVYFTKNGATFNGSLNLVQAVTGSPTFALVRATIIGLAAGDYVEMVGLQSSGVTLNTDNNTTDQPGMHVKYLGYYA
jgi:hypothetical protein